jgi:MFS superfamily sulfate permease-like transporter
MRSSATTSATIGVIIMTIILIIKSRYPYVVIVPDMFSAPYIIQMGYSLSKKINDDIDAFKVTFLLLIFLIISLSAILHISMSMFRLLRFAEFLPYSVFCGLFSAVGMTIVQRSILFAPGYQIIASMTVAILLSLKIIRQKETRPAMSFVSIVIFSVSIFCDTISNLSFKYFLISFIPK